MQEKKRKNYALRAWSDQGIAVREIKGRIPKARNLLPGPESNDHGGVPIAILSDEEAEAAAILLPLLNHIDDHAFDSNFSFAQSLDVLLELALRRGVEIGEHRKNAELARLRRQLQRLQKTT